MARSQWVAGLVVAVAVSACGGGEAAAPASTTAPPETSTTEASATTTPPVEGLGTAGQFLATAMTEEGFTPEEGECIARRLTDHYGGDAALMSLLAADESPADLDSVIEAATLACVPADRLLALETSAAQTATGPPAVFGGASCTDPAGDVRSEPSGWAPSIPVATGDLAELDLTVDGDVMTITVRTHSPAVPGGGPGPTPLIIRMILGPNDPAAPVIYDVELLHSTDASIPGSLVTVTALDVATDTALAAAQYDVTSTAPGLLTATLPLDAFGTAARSDFMMEIRSEWGPDHPIGSQAPLEWMVDSVCNGAVLVPVAEPGSASDEPTPSRTLAELGAPVTLLETGFAGGMPAGWYEQVWFKPAAAGGELSPGIDGLALTGLQPSSRAGAMVDLGIDVTAYEHLVVALDGVVTDQTLSGTGWNGREAPLALVVAYVDAAGVDHVGLGEDPSAPGQMFYRGFTVMPPDGDSTATNAVMVTRGAAFAFEFDLMTLDPPPVLIHSIAVDGGGWAPRHAEVYRVLLVAGS